MRYADTNKAFGNCMYGVSKVALVLHNPKVLD
jgi:hypothetical protein